MHCMNLPGPDMAAHVPAAPQTDVIDALEPVEGAQLERLIMQADTQRIQYLMRSYHRWGGSRCALLWHVAVAAAHARMRNCAHVLALRTAALQASISTACIQPSWG